MSAQNLPDELCSLIPETQDWNNGAGIDPEGWISCLGNYRLAVGYSLVFWPRFVLVEDYVLAHGATIEDVQSWEKSTHGDKRAVEAVINHLHISDLHMNAGEATEAQLRYLGRTLAQCYRAKLSLDFPDRVFEVTFPDQPGLDYLDYQLTFWQVRG